MGHLNGAAGVSAPAAITAAPFRAQDVDSNKNSSAPDVYRAICQVAKEISRDGIAKGRRNEQQGYGFRGIDDVYNALSALLAGADLCILPRMAARTQEERQTAGGKPLFYVTVQGDFDFVSARDGSRHTVTMYGEAMDSADKATNKAMSAAYKYCCMQVFCIPTEGMADADATTHEPAPKPAPKPRPVEEMRAAAGIDTGGNPVGTQAAADYVAQQKLAKGNQPAPWTNRGEMKRQFNLIRERIGEVVYLDVLKKYNVTRELNWKDAATALTCYHELLEMAVA